MHSVEISEKLGKALSELAHRTHRSERSYLEPLVERLLEDEEDGRLAMESMKNPGPTISLEELNRRLGISLDD